MSYPVSHSSYRYSDSNPAVERQAKKLASCCMTLPFKMITFPFKVVTLPFDLMAAPFYAMGDVATAGMPRPVSWIVSAPYYAAGAMLQLPTLPFKFITLPFDLFVKAIEQAAENELRRA